MSEFFSKRIKPMKNKKNIQISDKPALYFFPAAIVAATTFFAFSPEKNSNDTLILGDNKINTKNINLVSQDSSKNLMKKKFPKTINISYNEKDQSGNYKDRIAVTDCPWLNWASHWPNHWPGNY